MPTYHRAESGGIHGFAGDCRGRTRASSRAKLEDQAAKTYWVQTKVQIRDLTLNVNPDPGGVAEGSRGLSAKRDTPGTRGQESPSTPKGSQSRCVHATRVGEGDRKRRVARPPMPGAGNVADEREFREAFSQLETGEANFINKSHFDRFTMILRSAGYVTSDLIRAQNAVNFAYVLYLRGRAEEMNASELERLVRRWYVMSVLRGRYTGSPETAFDFDMRQIEARGLAAYTDAVIETELSSSFWSTVLPQEMDTSSAASPYFLAYQAAQVKLGDLGFLSRDITVRDLLLNRSDVHHVYPRNHLKKQGLSRSRYNQIANFVTAQSEINIAIGDKPPEKYFADLAEPCNGGKKKYGGISDLEEMRGNFRASCLPEAVLEGEVPSYDDFLEIRRKLMAAKMKRWFESL